MLKSGPVVVLGDENGAVILRNGNKPEYSSVILSQRVLINNDGFINNRLRKAYITGTVEVIDTLVEELELSEGKELPGRLYVIESKEPMYEGQTPRINPTTGEIVLIDGSPIYSKTFYDETGKTEDVLIKGVKSKGPRIAEPRVVNNVETSTVI